MVNYLNFVLQKLVMGILLFLNSQNHFQNKILMKSIICQQECQALDAFKNPFLVATKG